MKPRTQRPLRSRPSAHPLNRRRQEILKETIEALTATEDSYQRYHELAGQNVARWLTERLSRGEGLPSGRVEVHEGDWGEVTQALTRRYGLTFPVLNMANAYVAGGAYLQGTSAQEENMFRRSDCHLALKEEDLEPYDPRDGYMRYRPNITQLLEAQSARSPNRVSLDLERARVCVRGREEGDAVDLGYRWLADDELFPFYELKAAAVDLRDGDAFSPTECARRFHALLDTLEAAGQRVAVLGAHGCGAFMNPAAQVAEVFAGVLARRRGAFDLIAFAIFHAGYGPNNYRPFAERFRGW